MKNLWAPWRMSYILDPEKDKGGCLFDAAPDKPFAREHLILYRDQTVVTLLNRFPYANGHLLVAPARHVGELETLSAAENAALMSMLQHSVAILKEHLRPDGFNIGLNLGETAGAGVPGHLHFHIVPRWQGDHNFMTVLAEVRVIPEHIDAAFDKMLPAFQGLLTRL